MPSLTRRDFLASTGVALAAAASGCNVAGSSTKPAHTVSVYLAEREATRDVTVRIESDDGETLFEREYALSDDNEAHEDATFPESTAPETVFVTVDGTEFERQWPGIDGRQCDGDNWKGIEVYIEGQPDEEPSVRLDENCQHVTLTE